MLEELLEPLAGESPAGANLRYDPVYDQIKQARAEEDDVPQGEWRHERKTADFALVIKLASDALGRRSKDLQLAAWLTEARLRREGISGLTDGLELMRELMERFWDGLYPEIEDGDLELRAAPLDWVGQYLDGPVRAVPVTRVGYDMFAYRDSRVVGYEAAVSGDYERTQARERAIAEGRPSAEAFDEAFNSTPKSWYRALLADIEGARLALDALQGVTDERFGDVAPSFMKLRDALEELRGVATQLLAKKLETEPDPVEAVAAPEAAMTGAADASPGGGVAGGAASAAPGAAGPLPAMPRDREDAIARVAAAARFLRAQAPGDPAPYLVLRGLRWGELRAVSPLDPRLLSAPPTDVRSRLKGLLLEGRFADLVEAGEEVMAQPFGRGWLDLQRYIVVACEGLGGAYDTAAAAILGALRTLLKDLPELLEQTLMDDTPTANVETRAWLQQRGLIAVGEDEAAGGAPSPAPAARDALARAEALLRAGDSEHAIRLLLVAAEQEKSARARFLRRSQAARVMVESGFEAVALPILQEMTKQVEKHSLEEWEAGETVAQPLGLLYRCLDRLGYGPSDKEALYLRICRLDPLQAMKFASSAAQDATGG
jgi:type VI secretion system protein ImpA